MKLKGLIALIFATVIRISAEAQGIKKLSPAEFEAGIHNTSDAVLLDVRSPEEYQAKHLKGALNLNINGEAFQSQLASLDKSKTVYVYCLAGSRSAAAAQMMREKGFKEVYELDGGLNKWLADSKPVEQVKTSGSEEMSLSDLNAIIKSNKLTIIDFSAKWCVYCIKMKPFLYKAAREKVDKVSIVAVDADVSQEVVHHFKVSDLPTLILFKDSKQLLRHEGYLDQKGINELIEKYK